MSDDTVKTCI